MIWWLFSLRLVSSWWLMHPSKRCYCKTVQIVFVHKTGMNWERNKNLIPPVGPACQPYIIYNYSCWYNAGMMWPFLSPHLMLLFTVPRCSCHRQRSRTWTLHRGDLLGAKSARFSACWWRPNQCRKGSLTTSRTLGFHGMLWDFTNQIVETTYIISKTEESKTENKIIKDNKSKSLICFLRSPFS